MLNKAKMFVISAPSGTGKTTIINEVLKHRDLLKPISFTTRAPRINEINGVDYNFISEEEFEKRKNSDEFLEWAKVFDHYYATSLKTVKETLATGSNLIKDIDTVGALILKNVLKENAVLIFIMPPSLSDLESRLMNRSTDSEETIKLRLNNVKEEINNSTYYDYIIINDRLENAVSELIKVIDEYI